MASRAPFRADHVGSLLRPAAVKEARAAFAEGRLDAAGLKAVEDAAIAEAVRRQEAVGLQSVTDGEYRRAWFHYDFFAGLEGVEWVRSGQTIRFHGVDTKAEGVQVTGKVDFGDHSMLGHFRYLAGLTRATAKMTLPSPSLLHFRVGRENISRQVYPSLEPYFRDVAEAYRKALRGFYDAGCRYLQIDDTVWAHLCSPAQRQAARERGDDPDGLLDAYQAMINHALSGKPADMVVTTHVCRGNFRSSWISEGGYEPVAERLLAGTAFDGYLLEYDTERAGGFEPLRFLPKGQKRVVLGLVTSKSGTLEAADDLKRRIGEAARFAPLEQLCLSPQCGFASTEEGNLLEEDEQWKKLELVVRTAAEVWGQG